MLTGSMVLHTSLARTPAEQQEGVWLMEDESEASGIADPLANIANRYASGALVGPDTNDLIAAGIAVGAYIVRNAAKTVRIRWSLRRSRYVEYDDTNDPEGPSS